MNDTHHKLSIVVVTFNEARHVARLQASIDRLHKPDHIAVETILVDGGSEDGTADAARQAGFTSVVVMPGANIPVCRNRGIEEATGDWLAYVDGDCEVAEDWLEQALPFLREMDRALLIWPATPPEPMTWVQRAWLFHWLTKNRRTTDWNGRQVIVEGAFRLATTRNMILHRTIAVEIGGFREELSTGEDNEFATRAKDHGAQVLGVPELRVTHHAEPRTLKEFFKQQYWHANPQPYEYLLKKGAGNAPRYTLAFFAGILLALAGIGAAVALRQAIYLLLVLPCLSIVGLPALWMSLLGRTFTYFPALCVLYTAYGIARVAQLLGLAKQKYNWKSLPGGAQKT